MRAAVMISITSVLALGACDWFETGGRGRIDPSTLALDSCNSPRWYGMIGKPQAVIEAASLPDGARVIDFGAVVTQDYRPERLNFSLDPTGKVYRIWCG